MTLTLDSGGAAPTDPVRTARRLAAEAAGEQDSARLTALTAELRALDRPDLGLEIIATRSPETTDSVTEQMLCLESLGRYADALTAAGRLAHLAPASADGLRHEIRIRQRPGNSGLSQLTAARLRAVVTSTKNLRTVLTALPLAKVPAPLVRILSDAALRHAPASLTGLLSRAWGGRLATRLAELGVAFSLALLGRLRGGRRIHVTSLGNFTRLADLVDRVDPLIRRLDASEGKDAHALIVFLFDGYPNEKLYELYQRRCTFVRCRNRLTKKLARLCIAALKRGGRHTETTVDYRFNNQDFLRYPPAIRFTTAETERLQSQMRDAGIDPDRPFICFGLRDMAYYQFYGDVMRIPLTAQGKRADTHHRCPPLDTYLRFARHWADKGYQVVRMGLRVSQAIPDDLNPLIIDYANGPRSDELDAALLANCWFLTAGDTGLFSGAAAFDRPTILSDLFLIRNTMYSSNKQTPSIFVPKLIYDEHEGRLLSFREQIYLNPVFSYADDCLKAGFRIVHNTPEDLIDASDELVERLAGRFSASPEDSDLQRAFHKIYAPSHMGFGSTGVISSNFLKKHANLLD